MQLNDLGMIIGSKAIFHSNNYCIVLREGAKLRPWIHSGLPGGKLDKNEDMLSGLLRELAEELPLSKALWNDLIFRFNLSQPDVDGGVIYLTHIFSCETNDTTLDDIIKGNLNDNVEITKVSLFFPETSGLTIRQVAVFNEMRGFDSPFSVDRNLINPVKIDFNTYAKLKVGMPKDLSMISKWGVIDYDR